MTQKQFERGLEAAMIVIALGFFAVQAAAQTPATLLPEPKMQFLTDGGLVCSGCKVYTYAAGTTTPLVTYTSASGAVANANPVILDSAGRAGIWFTNLAYKVVLKTSADVQIWSVDNVSSFCTITGCDMTGQLSVTGSSGISVLTTSPGGSSFTSSASGGFGAVGISSNTGGNTAGVEGVAASANGTSFLGWNTAVGGLLFQGLNRAGSSNVFTVSNTGAIAGLSISINNATPITAQTGTGGTVVMSAAPALTGNMTYASTTPVANLTTAPVSYSISGTQQVGTHLVVGSCVLGTNCAITLSGAAVFTSSSTYFCFAQDLSAAAATMITYSSGSGFTITGTGTDTIRFGCIGN